MDSSALASQLAGLGSMPHESRNPIHMATNGMSESFVNLLYRNAQLETELRLVKEQLAQAQQSTQYLLRMLRESSSSQPARNMTNSANPRLDTFIPVARKDSVTETTEKPKDSVSVAPLVNFEETDSLLDLNAIEAAAGSTEPTSQAHIHPRKLKPDSIGLKISQTKSSQSSFAMTTTEEATPSLNSASPSFRQQQQQQPGFTIRQSDGTSMFVPNQPMDNPLETPFRSMTSSEPLPILGHEHRSLAGKAFVWVEMTAEELTEVIARYAKEHPRHTAEEYRSYFEDVIRPAYHKQERERAQARAAQVGSEGVVQDIGDPSTNSSQSGGEQEGAAVASSPESESSGESIEAQTLIDEHSTVGKKGPAEVKDNNCSSELANVAGLWVHSLEEQSPVAHLAQAGARADERTLPNQLRAEIDATGGLLAAKEPETEASGDFAPESELVPTTANVTPSTTVTSTPSTADYHPPRLYNPAALGDAKVLQAEFQSRVPSRGRRHMDPSSRPERHDSKASNYPGGGDRQGFNSTSYITYPNEVQDLFATAAEGDEHPHRTVLVTNIPPSTTLLEVLSRIHSGHIFSSIFLETSGMRTKPPISTATALVTFLRGRDAIDFTKHSTEHPFSVQLLPTMSRPIHASAESQTRILSISDPKNIWTANEVVLRLIANGAPHPLKAESSPGDPGLLLFHFASMPEAQLAYHAISRDYTFFGNVEKGYFADPCAKPFAADENGVENIKPLALSTAAYEVEATATSNTPSPTSSSTPLSQTPHQISESDTSLHRTQPLRIPENSGIHTKIPYQSIMFEG